MEFQIDVYYAILSRFYFDVCGLPLAPFAYLLLFFCGFPQVGLALTLAIVFGYYSFSVFGSLIGQVNRLTTSISIFKRRCKFFFIFFSMKPSLANVKFLERGL